MICGNMTLNDRDVVRFDAGVVCGDGMLYVVVATPGSVWPAYLKNVSVPGHNGLFVDHDGAVWRWNYRRWRRDIDRQFDESDDYHKVGFAGSLQRVRVPATLARLFGRLRWRVAGPRRVFAIYGL